MKGFIRFSVNHPVTTVMFSAALVLLGILGTSRMETALLPDIAFPRLTVVTIFRDESPEGIEKRVTRPVEEALSGVRGLVRSTSSSLQGISVVRLTLDWKTDINYAAMEAREKLDLARNALPQDAERPVVLKYDPNAAPLLQIACVAKDPDDRDIRTFIERDIKPQLQRLDGVGGVKISGGYLPEVRVDVDPAKLSAVSLSLSDLVQVIAAANFNTPAGPLPEGDREVMVRTVGEFTSADEIAGIMILPDKDRSPFRLDMMARVTSGWREKRSETLYGFEPSVGISVYNDSLANQVATAKRVTETLENLGKKYASRLQFRTVVDRSIYISEAVTDVTISSVLGGVLAFVVLLVFLKRLPESSILALSIPICVAATLFLMFVSGITLNVISLGGLALGIGMTVDSGIVVAESIRKRNEAGMTGVDAVVEGTAEVATPVFASIWTTIVVFVPIMFTSGLSGRLFGQMALTVSFSMLVSIYTALAVIPMALAAVARREARKHRTQASVAAAKPVLVVKWERVIAAWTRKKKTVFLTAFVMFAVAIPFFLLLGRDFLPSGERQMLQVRLNFPADMQVAEKQQLAARFLKASLASVPGASAFTEIGIDDSDPTAAASDRNPSTGYAFLTVPGGTTPATALERVRSAVGSTFPVPYTIEIDTTLIEGIESAGTSQIKITLSGEDEAAEKAAPLLVSALKQHPCVAGLATEGMEKREEIKVVTDRRKAASLGVDVESVASAIRASLAGDVATQFRKGDREIDVRVRFAERYREGEHALTRIRLRTSSGELVPLAYVAAFERGMTGSRLFRENGKRSYQVSVTPRGPADAARAELRTMLARFSDTHGINASLSGADETDDNLSGLLFAFALAVLLVYMVMAAQFEHFFMPLVVLVSLPLSFIGSFALMFLTGTTINTISAMGMIMLAGIAVNNAIVLYDRFKQNMLSGMTSEAAAVEAAISRTRPILMTTATAFMGFLPLVLIGASLQRDLAMAAIGGLVTSHGLTLLLLPGFFSFFGRRLAR